MGRINVWELPDEDYYRVDDNGCWRWLRCKAPEGYARISNRYAHRWMYERKVGKIPDGKVLDHLCRVRDCVNPEHLEPVTHQQNCQRGSRGYLGTRRVCKRGHVLLSDDDFYISPDGRRQCSACVKIRSKKPPRVSGPKKLKTECVNGHEYTNGSFRFRANGSRQCIVCDSARRERARKAVRR